AEADVDDGESVRGYVVRLRHAVELVQTLTSTGRLAAERIHLTHGGQDIWHVARHGPALVQQAECIQVVALLRVGAPQARVAFVKRWVVLDQLAVSADRALVIMSQ